MRKYSRFVCLKISLISPLNLSHTELILNIKIPELSRCKIPSLYTNGWLQISQCRRFMEYTLPRNALYIKSIGIEQKRFFKYCDPSETHSRTKYIEEQCSRKQILLCRRKSPRLNTKIGGNTIPQCSQRHQHFNSEQTRAGQSDI